MNNRNCGHDRGCKLCKGRKIDLYSASCEQWGVWARARTSPQPPAATVATAEWMQPLSLSRILARGHDDLVSSANMGWTPTKNIFVKKLYHIYVLCPLCSKMEVILEGGSSRSWSILILLGLLLWIIHCVERRQWYESGYSSGGGACVPGSVHAYPSSGGEYSWALPAARATTCSSFHLGSSPLSLHMSGVTHSSPV